MKTLKRVATAMIMAGATLGAAASNAAIITRTYAFELSDFQIALGSNAPPLSEVSGVVTLTFDDALSFSGQTTGISIADYVGPALGSTLAFSSFGGPGDSHGIAIGGLASGVGLIASGSSDFVLQVEFADASYDNPFLPMCSSGFTCGSAAPTTFASGYTISGTSGGWLAAAGSVSVVPVPEPSSWALMILGFGGIGAVLRRRPQVATV
ncbi:PEPxxWA-CTERM sorting domain-containing protein [uncultured Phenylobacterium sp.]|uniref:PEPxxWA-CTERM sorting domain-containing protein n=1 Tax=uncultured Phenylobacterium sp. TaxID=349273 RepID=UPI0025CBD988|nr:PEPxxWA-CTERM sorting domain-containing protein [uncultured Phenylobacterium sp.]